ncbi:MAG: hypothetical protein WC528_04180 [Patescibacteria group bacterium]
MEPGLADRAKLPPDTIQVINGQVVEIEEYTLWNLEPCLTISITRQEKSFVAIAQDPEHGGTRREGSLEEVLSLFHPKIAKPFRQAFQLENATPALLKKLLPRHQILGA